MKIKLLYLADDWMGLYIDGELVYENHSINARDVLRDGMKLRDFEVSYEDHEALEAYSEDMGSCPETWAEVLEIIGDSTTQE